MYVFSMSYVHTWFVLVCTMNIQNVTDINCVVLPRWSREELKKVIAMLHNPEFDSKDVDPDLHQRMHNAVLDGRTKCFNM
jgi:hypothetical protein